MSYKTARVSKCAPRNGTKRQKKKNTIFNNMSNKN